MKEVTKMVERVVGYEAADGTVIPVYNDDYDKAKNQLKEYEKTLCCVVGQRIKDSVTSKLELLTEGSNFERQINVLNSYSFLDEVGKIFDYFEGTFVFFIPKTEEDIKNLFVCYKARKCDYNADAVKEMKVGETYLIINNYDKDCATILSRKDITEKLSYTLRRVNGAFDCVENPSKEWYVSKENFIEEKK